MASATPACPAPAPAPAPASSSSTSGDASTSKPLSLPAALLHAKHPRLLLHELLLLHQLLYKSAAQYLSAKWVQSVRALRRCGRRIFGPGADGGDDGRGRGHHRSRRRRTSPGELKTTSSRAKSASTSTASLPAPTGGVFGRVQTRADALSSAPHRTATAASAQGAHDARAAALSATGVLTLPVAHMGEAAWQRRCDDVRASVRDLVALLRHLVERSRASYAIITAHLNTPPAPTFAPLATALLAICAQCGSIAEAWAADLERIDWSRRGPAAKLNHSDS